MGNVIVALSVSLDGFIAGPNDGPEQPLGEGGERVFAWMSAGAVREGADPRLAVPEASLPVVENWEKNCGAMITGRRTFDIADGWADGHPIDAPIFVVTHAAPTSGRWSPACTFVTEGPEAALEQARAVAGDKEISVGGADVARQLLRAGLLDVIEAQLTPCLLGGGVRLFEALDGPIDLEQESVIPSVGVTHLRYRVVR